jgi:hypothetical protein
MTLPMLSRTLINPTTDELCSGVRRGATTLSYSLLNPAVEPAVAAAHQQQGRNPSPS